MPARATEVVSSNIVGYAKITMRANGYTLIANPFVEVGTGDNILIKDMFSDDATAANDGSSASDADTIEVWTGDSYDTYFFRTGANAGDDPYWMKVGERKPTNDDIPVGAGAFYHNASASGNVVLTISGEVKGEAETLTIYSGYNLLKNPFPTELSFDTFVVAEAKDGASASDADTIEVWTGDSYDTYFLRTGANAGDDPYWMKVGERKKTTDTIAPYSGFFYHATGNAASFTVVVNSPISE